MKPTTFSAVLGVFLAAGAAVGGLFLASSADQLIGRLVGALLLTVVPFAVIYTLGRSRPPLALMGLILIPTLLFAVGVTFISLGAASKTGGGSAPSAVAGGAATERLPGDPQARLLAAFDHADEVLPNGSRSLLSVDLRDTSMSLRIYDPNTGDAIYSNGNSDGRWYGESRSRATDRRTFGRGDLGALNLTAAVPLVRETAEALQLTADDAHPADGISVSRRSDGLLLAEFTVGNRPIQVNTEGVVADTVGAGFLDTMLDTTAAVLRDLQVDPAAPALRDLDFRTIADGSSPLMASSIQNSGGVAIDFNAGPYESLTIVPGCFPETRERSSREYPGFALTQASTAALLRARDDLLQRNDLPAFDGALVGLQLGDAPGNRDQGAVLRMRVGPPGAGGGGVYTLDGQFVRAGAW